MNPVYFNDKPTQYMDDQDYAKYMRLYVNPQNPDPNQREGAVPTYNTDMTPVSQEPKANSLESYANPGGDPSSGLWARGGVGLGASGAALMGAGGPMLGGAGLFLTAAELGRQAIHGESWTPDKYKTLSAADRNNYLDNQLTPTVRARNLSEMSQENQYDNPRLIKYLSQIQPYEDMAYFNPGDKDQSGKYRAYANTQWARQRMQDRYLSDMDAQDAQELAKKYDLTVPDPYKGKTPFSVNYSRGY